MVVKNLDNMILQRFLMYLAHEMNYVKGMNYPIKKVLQLTAFRVMIVDDEAIFRTGLTHLHDWSKESIEIVAQASNGAEALELIELVSPHVIITDIMMPIMDGIDLVKNVRKKYPDIKMIILSSYSEFELVREVFKYGVDDYLLKPKVTVEELVTLIHSSSEPTALKREYSAPLLKEPSIIVSQWFEQEELALTDRHELLTQLPKQQFSLLVTSITMLQSLTNASQYELEQYMLQQCYEHFSKISHIAVFTKQYVSVVLNVDAEEELQLKPQLVAFIKAVNEKYDKLKFVHSNSMYSIDELQAKYAKLQQLLTKAIYFNQRSLILENEVKLEHTEVHFDHDAFVNSIKWFTFNHAREQLQLYFENLSEVQGLDEYSLKRFIQHIIYTMMSALEHLRLPFTEHSTEKLFWFKRIDQAATLGELQHIINEFIDMVEKQVSEHNEQGEVNTLNQIIDFIHANYEQDISLAELAEKFHMNYSYLSWYFKQRTSENLTAYINKVRIEKAKELLKYTDDSISLISTKIGFSEHNYFSKVFKKFVGMTPLEYRHQQTR